MDYERYWIKDNLGIRTESLKLIKVTRPLYTKDLYNVTDFYRDKTSLRIF